MSGVLSLLWVLIMLIATTSAYAQTIMLEALNYEDHAPVRVTLSNGKIQSIQKLKKRTAPGEPIYLAPGLIDNQVNGFAGVSFALGHSELDVDGVKKATAALWRYGVTSYLPTLTTHSYEVLSTNFKILAQAKQDAETLGSIIGFHLEGPYINPADGYRGAHPRAYVRLPDWEEFSKLYESSGQCIKQVTLAPEMSGAIEFIKQCTSKGIIAAIGHHNADKSQIDAAVSTGAKIATHLGNGCANMINRHYNPLWPQLANDDLMISIICDGFHLLPEEVKNFYKIKGPDKTIITSDVTSYASLKPGLYTIHTGDTIELTTEGKLHFPAQGTMYGSASPLNQGIGHIMMYTGCSLKQAIQMASTNVAKLYGIQDRGSLSVGKRGDVILFTMDHNKMEILKTYVAGKLVYEKK